MSGLAVLYHRDGRPVEAAALHAMLAAIPYRGPDGTESLIRGDVALGHAMNAVTPEDVGTSQPLVSSRTGCTIVADARLDNREELRGSLPDSVSSQVSDAELILRAYENWGRDAAARLLGDFAFAIWDPRHERIWCVRDTSGQRTLFYRLDDRTFAAGSEIHQLFQDPTVPIEPNEERIRAFLTPMNVYRNEQDDAQTYFSGIFAVPAGHALTVERDRASVIQYWELLPSTELRYQRDEEYAEHYLTLFSEVVRARLRSVRPIGILLSGGLDSASVACVAQELYRRGEATDRGFRSYSTVFDDLECDEEPLIRDIQAKYGFEARFMRPVSLTDRIGLDLAGFVKGPNIGNAASQRDVTLEAAERDGSRAILTGHVADSCVYGSRQVFDSLLRRGSFHRLWRHLQAFRRVYREPLRTVVALDCLAPLLPLEVQRRVMVLYVDRALRRMGAQNVPPWIREPMRGDLVRRHRDLVLESERRRRFSSPARHESATLLSPPEIAHHPAPWTVEYWRPFADRRLHTFLLAIPPDQKFEPHPDTDEFYAGSKWLVRRALRGILPESVRTRTSKTQFSSWFNAELDRQWPAYEALFGPDAKSHVEARGYVDQAQFWSRLTRLRQGNIEGDFIWVMKVIGLERWLRAIVQPRDQFIVVPPARGTASPDAGGRRSLGTDTVVRV